MIKGVIFDMDGTIIDNELIQSKSYEMLLRQYGISPILNEQGVAHNVGIKEEESWEILKRKYNFEEDISVLIRKRSSIYLSLLAKEAKVMPGLIPLLKLLKAKKIKLAVGSSSLLEHIMTTLSILGITGYFSTIISGQFVPNGKPAPDIFIEAVRKLQVEPEHCIVLEDTQVGVESAKNGNLKVIAIPNKFTRNQDFSKADITINSLKDINWNLISSI